MGQVKEVKDFKNVGSGKRALEILARSLALTVDGLRTKRMDGVAVLMENILEAKLKDDMRMYVICGK